MIHSDTEDESTAGVVEEGASNCSQWIDLTNSLIDDISIIEERRVFTSSRVREKAGQDQEVQRQQDQPERLGMRRQPKATIAMVDLTMPEPSGTVKTDLTNRANPVINTAEVLDLTTPTVDLEVDLSTSRIDENISEVDLTTSEVDLNTIAAPDNTLLCPVCLDPMFELDDGRLNPYHNVC